MIIKEFIVWTKKIHLLTIDENIHCQYEQNVLIIWDLVKTQKPRQIQIIFLVFILLKKKKLNNSLIITDFFLTFHIKFVFP
jgi:hypothetical protein